MALVFVDLETTGLIAGKHEIWECGAVKHRDDSYPEEQHWFVHCDLMFADPEALAIGRFSERHNPDKAVLRRDFIGEFCEWVAGDTLAANNACFDISFLKSYAEYSNMPETWHYSPIDVKSFAAGALRLRHPFPKTSGIAKLLDVPENDNAHTALADARFAREIYFAALARQ